MDLVITLILEKKFFICLALNLEPMCLLMTDFIMTLQWWEHRKVRIKMLTWNMFGFLLLESGQISKAHVF